MLLAVASYGIRNNTSNTQRVPVLSMKVFHDFFGEVKSLHRRGWRVVDIFFFFLLVEINSVQKFPL